MLRDFHKFDNNLNNREVVTRAGGTAGHGSPGTTP
jgi:hypothetical protein